MTMKPTPARDAGWKGPSTRLDNALAIESPNRPRGRGAGAIIASGFPAFCAVVCWPATDAASGHGSALRRARRTASRCPRSGGGPISPAFLFGLSPGPISSRSSISTETSAEAFEPVCRYPGREPAIGTVVPPDEAARLARDGATVPEKRAVMLAFDDAWASSLAGRWRPLLERSTKASGRSPTPFPGAWSDAPSARPSRRWMTAQLTPRPADHGPASPFVTWPELRALAASGRVDVQSHTLVALDDLCRRQSDRRRRAPRFAGRAAT